MLLWLKVLVTVFGLRSLDLVADDGWYFQYLLGSYLGSTSQWVTMWTVECLYSHHYNSTLTDCLFAHVPITEITNKLPFSSSVCSLAWSDTTADPIGRRPSLDDLLRGWYYLLEFLCILFYFFLILCVTNFYIAMMHTHACSIVRK